MTEEKNLFDGSTPIETALAQLRLRLLDLTARNRLINFKHTPGKALQLVPGSLEQRFLRLLGATTSKLTILPVPDPTRDDWIERNGRMVKPDAREFAQAKGIITDFDQAEEQLPFNAAGAQAIHYAEDLGKHIRKIDREARLAIEETGANMLFLVFGFLEFQDSKDEGRTLLAPLVSVPVVIEKTQEGQRASFKIVYTGEEIEENLSLREKLNRDYQLILPDFPDEEEGIENYLKSIGRMTQRRPGWRVRRMLSLSLLSFSNMLLVKDLEPEKWLDADGASKLLSHPIVRQVFEGKAQEGGLSYAQEYQIDEDPKFDFPLIFDADSSQHSAIFDVMSGRTMVIEGPPGTGKSQTITNIIAACISAGKSVLFVAEKLAALQVVKSRLDQAQLGPFILELHSNKTNRKQVVDSLAERCETPTTRTGGIANMEQDLLDKKMELKRHAQLLQSQVGNALGCSIQQIIWRAERPRMRLGDDAAKVRDIALDGATEVNSRDYRICIEQVGYLADQFKVLGKFDVTHPFWGFYPEAILPGDELGIGAVLYEASSKSSELNETTSGAVDAYGFVADGSLDFKGIGKTIEELNRLSEALDVNSALDVLPRVFQPDAELSSAASQMIMSCERTIGRMSDIEAVIQGNIRIDGLSQYDVSQECLAEIERLGLKQVGLQEFSAALQRVMDILDQSSKHLSLLLRHCAHFEVDDPSESARFEKLSALVRIAKACPLEVIHLRVDGLCGRNSVEILARALAERKRLQLAERSLNETLYLDQTPDSDSLRSAILTLRKGSAWYRFLQKDWRRAVGLHRSLQRTKQSLPPQERLIALEKLSDLEAGKKAWLESGPLKSTAGDNYDGVSTPLEELIALSTWLRVSRDQLSTHGIDCAVLDPMTANQELIRSLRGIGSAVDAAMAHFGEFDANVSKHIRNVTARTDAQPVHSWSDRIRFLSEVLHRQRGAADAFTSVDLQNRTPFELHNFVELARELKRLSDGLEGSKELAHILGERHATIRKDISAIVRALQFGSMVADSNLPPTLKVQLWRKEAAATLTACIKKMQHISDMWVSHRQAVDRLAAYGGIDAAEWQKRDQQGAFGSSLTSIKCNGANQAMSGLIAWSQYVEARASCVKLKLDQFVYLLEEDVLSPAKIADAFAYRFHASIADKLFRRAPELARFSSSRHNSVRDEYRRLDKELIELRGRQISSMAIRAARPPQGASGARVDDKTEMHLIELLIGQTRPRVTVRALLRRAGLATRALKPCFMMGPQAVAQFLDSSSPLFDVVIMDEASQLKPEEAIGSIVRGRQLVVVGDPKQLPPTSFFSRAQAADDGQAQMAAVDAESILDVATSHFPPVRSLRWHYRSRHESLIAFSNHSFYRGKLVVFPSPLPRSRGLGVRLHYVADGVYESQMNQVEATRVVDFIVDHICNKPDESLGVVTLNVRQRDLIAELLEERLASFPEADAFRENWEAAGQPLFVKNLENVQGDERDAILISTTFGRGPGASRPHQNFGPISQDGGWRRLNVLFTRAKRSILVVTSLRDTDIVVNEGQTPRGTKALRDYLVFAATGALHYEPGVETGLAPDSDFEVSVIEALTDAGYECVPQVGVASFRIDIGVKHPDYPHLFLAGIECDGASYHSGVTVRDRDRIRQEILESIGWRGKLWRIWSTQWFRNPREEMRRLISFLQDLRSQPVDAASLVHIDESSASSEDQAVPVTDPGSAENAEVTAQNLISDLAEREVQIGDLIGYVDVDSASGTEYCVTIAERRHDTVNGIIGQHTPLAQILLGAVVGEEVTLHVPGHPDRRFRVTKVVSGSR